jgi:hypothetical protein
VPSTAESTSADRRIPYGYCHCGCGGRTPVAQKTYRARGHVKGEPQPLLCGHHPRRFLSGPPPPAVDGALWIPLRAQDGSSHAWALVDAEDAHLAELPWSLKPGGYAYRRNPGTHPPATLLLHRVLLGLTYGDGLQGDHINRDRLDCRRANLRVVTQAQNAQNRDIPRDGESRFRGVSRKRSGWRARVTIDYRERHIGHFATELEAALAVDAYRREQTPFAEPDPALIDALRIEAAA